MSKQLNTRIQYKYDTHSNWEICEELSLKGELYIHENDNSSTSVTIGDGLNKIKDLNSSLNKKLTIIENLPYNEISLVYTGEEQMPMWVYESTELIISGELSATYAGQYTTTFIPREGYCWPDRSTTGKDFVWEIQKATRNCFPEYTEYELNHNQSLNYAAVYYDWIDFPDIIQEDTNVTIESNDPQIAQGFYEGPYWEGGFNITLSQNGYGVDHDGITGVARLIISIPETANYEATSCTIVVNANFRSSLDDYTWEEISEMANSWSDTGSSLARDYFSVGDTKEICIAETATTENPVKIQRDDTGGGDNSKNVITSPVYLKVFILGIDHTRYSLKADTWKDHYGITFGTFKDFNGNDVTFADAIMDYNQDMTGVIWRGTFLRNSVLGSNGYDIYGNLKDIVDNPPGQTLIAAFPKDLRKVMKPIPVTSIYYNGIGNVEEQSFDYLPLLGTCELTDDYYTNHGRYDKYAYYNDGNARSKDKTFWLRDIIGEHIDGEVEVYPQALYTNGEASSAYPNDYLGLAPIFFVGMDFPKDEF